MLGHNVVPVLLLSSWIGTGSDLDGRCCGPGSLHFPDCLVRNPTAHGRALLIYVGNSVYAILKFVMSATLAKCFSTAGDGCGMPLP